MKIAHVIGRADVHSSGPTHSVTSLCESLHRLGHRVELHAGLADAAAAHGFRIVAHGRWRWPARLGVSMGLSSDLRQVASGVDVLHAHSVWDLSAHYAAGAAQAHGCRFVVSTRGALHPAAWRRGQLHKDIAWLLWQRSDLGSAACLHATSEQEYLDIRRRGLRNPVMVLPNGVAVPPLQDGPAGDPAALYMGRITPIKGLPELIRAWREVQDQAPMWRLIIAGPDDRGHLGELRSLALRLGAKRVEFVGPVYGRQKEELFRRAAIFVSPSKAENFGMATAEALAHGLPVITTQSSPWEGLRRECCGWWIPAGVSELAVALRGAMGLPFAELREMGRRGSDWMARDFGWDGVGRRMASGYAWLLGLGERPSWVRTE
jgi:glycosyltransferase involved in cell wall biosynthesis